MRFSGKFIASAAVAAGMIAAPTAAANAASVSAWDQVAACEAETGRPIPVTATTADCSSRSRPGADTAVTSTHQRLTRPPRSSRLRLASACLPPRVLAHGRTAVARWVNPPHHQRSDLARPRMTATTSCSGHGVLSSSGSRVYQTSVARTRLTVRPGRSPR